MKNTEHRQTLSGTEVGLPDCNILTDELAPYTYITD